MLHWRLAWQGQFQGKELSPTIVLEAPADHNLWFWHHAFGYAGTLNDFNIFDQSPLLKAFLDGTFTNNVDFSMNVEATCFQSFLFWLTASTRRVPGL
jgi:hypothetical protein